MKKLTRIFLWLMVPAVMLFSTSCFDIVEEYHFHRDGSGTATIKMDISSMMSMLDAFGGGESSSESTAEIDKMFEDNETIETLKNVPGISNVTNISNREEGIVGWTYDFASIEALNNSINTGGDLSDLASSMGMSEEVTEDKVNKMALDGKKFTRIHPTDDAKKEKTSEEDKESAELAAAMLAEGEYKIIYHFDQRVKSTNMEGAVISDDGHTVVVKTNLGELSKGEIKMGGKIKLK
jgi:hypothetical protein